MKAVGAYLQTLREGRGLSRVWVAEQAGTNDTSIYRVEQRGQESKPKILIPLVRAVRGSFDDIGELLKDDDLPIEEGVKLAEVRLRAEHDALIDESSGNIDHTMARQLADRVLTDPEFLEDFIRSVAESGRRRR